MSLADRIAGGIVRYRRPLIAVLLVLTVLVGSGASMVEESASMSAFDTGSTAEQKQSYIRANFTASEGTTTVQVIVRDENVLSKASLLDVLRFEQRLLANETVAATLSSRRRPVSIANVVATAAIRQRQARSLSKRARALQARRADLNRTARELSDALNRTRRLQARYDALNRSYARGAIDEAAYERRSRALERNLSAVRERATASLSAESAARFGDLFARTRSLQSRLDALNASYAAGNVTRATYEERAAGIQRQFREVYDGIEQVLAPEVRELEKRAAQLRADRVALQQRIENGTSPPLSKQIATLEAMNASQIDATIRQVLGADSGSDAFALMPKGYEPGSTSAEATMVVVTQTTESETVSSSAPQRIVDSQLAIQALADAELDGESMVFGVGIITDEIDRSMQDSMTVVGPFALLFVLVVLTIAYRDLLDIVLGVVGIFVVLLVTFGFMGWTGIRFSQIMVAVPVLLIGLSIDYAIHVFMRYREQYGEEPAVDGAMGTALAGVGMALVLVTGTTVIGFLSNLVSPLGPIQEFGIVSSVGILAAFVVFGALMPALKIELDGLLERLGFDREKRAFGTGGGRFSRFLALGSTAARRAPYVVIALVLVVSAAGAYGAMNVDTSFEQKDFVAEEPPDWMDSLPGPMQPGNYTVRETMGYVNDHFLRQDATVQFLYEGDVATAGALQRVAEARAAVSEKSVTFIQSNGEAAINGPLSVMHAVAATNETFNATLAAADTDGDGVPDRNVEAVYDALFAAAPDRAARYIHRVDGEYRALRLTAALEGGVSGEAVRTQMNDIEAQVSGDGVRVTATGQSIVRDIVQNALLDTVVKSLLLTLLASFVFLMVVYRITEGSASLGLVTLLPVAFNVTWILGTMYVVGIPFNVLTGMITSLTVGLGVAYSIHVSERYSLELDRQESAWDAMRTAVTGTGGALLGSAATTVGGFGVLVFAILPPLQQFGLITALTIVYAFLGSVFVLPSLLVVWTRLVGPAAMLDVEPSESTRPPTPAGADDDD